MKQWQRREICAAIPARHFLFCPVQRFFNPAKSLHATPSKYGRSPVHLPRRLQSPGCSGGYGGAALRTPGLHGIVQLPPHLPGDIHSAVISQVPGQADPHVTVQ